jgi:hypothetical protein
MKFIIFLLFLLCDFYSLFAQFTPNVQSAHPINSNKNDFGIGASKQNTQLLPLTTNPQNQELRQVFGVPNSASHEPLYNRDTILQLFAKILNEEASEYTEDNINFRIENGEPIKFTIYDLTNPTNNSIDNPHLEFIEGHIYHFSSLSYYYSFHNICFLDKGKIKVFTAINCKSSKEKIEEVLVFAKQKLSKSKGKRKILKRIANYRKYGIYIRECNMSFRLCECFDKIKN